MNNDESCHLHGIGVLITRPQHQSDALSELVAMAHGRPIRLPTIEICPSTNPDKVVLALKDADQADLLIFTSRNAVQFAFPLLPDILPDSVTIAAIGDATAQKLESCGLPPTLVPDQRFDSESLLALPELQQLQDQKVIIIRGEGGRTLLGKMLADRGAQVCFAEVYRRQCPERRPAGLISGWQDMVHCITITSCEGLDNLFTILGDSLADNITDTPIIAISQRIVDYATAKGCTQVLLANNASDDAIMTTLCNAFVDT